MSSSLDSLLRPFEHKSLKLRNRVAMAPMTRTFSPGYVPNDQVVGYYQRRAEGEVGLIITEGTFVGHKAATGYERVPAIYADEAVAGGEGGGSGVIAWRMPRMREGGENRGAAGGQTGKEGSAGSALERDEATAADNRLGKEGMIAEFATG